MKITSIPQIYRNVNRWGEILSVLSKYGLADWISRFDVSFARALLKNRNGEVLANQSRETRIRLAMEELGPAFIKLGQILSTRPDQIGAALAHELQKLQTSVPADPPEVVRETVEAELGQPLDDLFAEFDEHPSASASIGQVHCARLHSGEQLVVKVQHRDVQQRFHVDLDILTGLAQLAEKVDELRPYRPQATVAEFQRTLRRELDFSREERHLQTFNRNFAGNRAVRFPQSYPHLSTSRVMTMERLDGVKLSDSAALAQAEFDMQEVARNGAQVYLEMIFEHGFYHADPHPGNLVLLPGGVIGVLDAGMVGRLDETLREDIEDMLWAITTQDPQQLTSIVMRVGMVPAGLDETTLHLDLADFVAHYTSQPLDAFDLGGALTEIIEITRRYQIILPAGMAMLLKVLIMLEGTAQLLSPNFSLMEVFLPHQKRLQMRRLSPFRRAKKIRRIYGELEHLAEVLPRRLRDILLQVERGSFDVHLDHRGLEPSVNRLVLGMLASALFLGSSLLLSQGVWVFHGISIPGALGCGVAVALGLRLLRAIRKSGHLDRRR